MCSAVSTAKLGKGYRTRTLSGFRRRTQGHSGSSSLAWRATHGCRIISAAFESARLCSPFRNCRAPFRYLLEGLPTHRNRHLALPFLEFGVIQCDRPSLREESLWHCIFLQSFRCAIREARRKHSASLIRLLSHPITTGGCPQSLLVPPPSRITTDDDYSCGLGIEPSC